MAKETATKAAEWYKSPADGETLDVGPEKSPYTSPICKIYFKNQQPFTIPRDLIRASVELDKICGSSNSSIHIKNMPDEAGHVLVHYLCTSTWQTLCKRHSLQHSKASTHLETSVHVYAAARAYGLPGLAELAKKNICQSADALPAQDVIALAADVCELLPEDDSWFLAFTQIRIESLFKGPSSLNQSVFLACFDIKSTYSKIMVKSLVHICCQNSVLLKPAESTESSILSPLESSTVPGIDVTPSTDSPQVSDSDLEFPIHLPPGVDADVAVEAPAVPEAAPWEPSVEVVEEAPAEPEAAPWEPSVEVVEEAPAEPEAAPCESNVEVPDEWQTLWQTLSKKNKKNKKSKAGKAPALSCSSMATHIVDGGWKDCSSCFEFVGGLLAR
ncbi:hypothetical protein Ct61P_01800 [Colletotrichum tofieldiae]|nr:hypothetical protein Ct61P_01800 [Colletotrichum tofieldiae]